jgi:hypothetical protein
MARYKPPGYKMVRRKVPPTPALTRPAVPQETQNILQKQKDLQEAVKLQQSGQAQVILTRQAADAEEAAMKEAKLAKRREVAAKAKKAKAKVTKPKTAKKAVATKKIKEIKEIKWSEDDTQKVLYAKAKKAGLDVRTKDWKSEIVSAITKHNKKASK